MKLSKLKVVDRREFSGVFGGYCFLKYFPEILTEGVDVMAVKQDDDTTRYYIYKDGGIVNNSAFFTEKELNMGMKFV